MNILIVDDEPFVLRTLKEMIESAGWENIHTAKDGEEAVHYMQKQSFDLVISDIRMPGMDGMQLIQYMDVHSPHTKVILLTGYKDIEYAQEAIRFGVMDYLLKPASIESILKAINRVNRSIQGEENEKKLNVRRQKDMLEKRLDDLLIGIPMPYFDDSIIPEFNKICIMSCYIDEGVERWNLPTALSAIKNVTEEFLKPYGNIFTVINETHIVVIAFINREFSGIEKKMAQSLYKQIEMILKIKLLIGLSGLCEQLNETSRIYMESVQALEAAKKKDLGPIVNYNEIKDSPRPLSPEYIHNLEPKKNRRVVALVLELMQKRLCSTELSLKTIAEEVYLSPDYLGKII
ncbi:response regulator [Paenibacillus piri]|uniref:Response regulator n=1 Tax=Paenibacillus piri TaxID=2547395 RepID=A0A4R5KWE6_9BACL|nr:response regulator [Paenibacillus piri]TDF99498.1 response regulator [Paenibacillus piri]